MFYNEKIYTLRTEVIGGLTRYYVAFRDGQGIRRETDVSRPVYLEFLRFVKDDKRQENWADRHIEQSEQTEESLFHRAMNQPRSVDETVFDSLRREELRRVIQSLPEKQRRRFVLHHEFGLTYEQIAAMEGCSKSTAFRVVRRAEEIIKNNFENT